MKLWVLLVAVALVVGAPRADAAELHVLSAGAVRSIVTDLAAAFEKETGQTVKLTFGTVGVIKSKLASADPADVAIMTDTALDEMTRQGVVRQGTWAMVGRTGIGVGVRGNGEEPVGSAVAAAPDLRPVGRLGPEDRDPGVAEMPWPPGRSIG